MAITKENVIGNTNPMFLRFLNRESSPTDILMSVSLSEHPMTAEAAKKALDHPPDLDLFRKELEEAVRDIIKEGIDKEFKAFVNHYMEPSITEEISVSQSPLGQNRSQMAFVKDPESTWVQGMICYNLCLFVKAFGLDSLKACKVCGKLFAHKGKYAVYCSDVCKDKKKQ